MHQTKTCAHFASVAALIFFFLLVGCGERNNVELAVDTSSLNWGCDAVWPAPCAAEDSSWQLQLLQPPFWEETNHTLYLSVPTAVNIQRSYLEGVSMYMGRIPLRWQVTDDPLRYRTEVMVGACTTSPMVWALVIEWRTADGAAQQSRWEFTSQRPR